VVFPLPLLKQIIAAVHRLAPPELAEEWDRIGLQVDRANPPVQRVMVALDLNSQVMRAAQNERIDGFIVHHPFLFKPITRINYFTPQGQILAQLIQNDQFLLAAHTNLDKAARGINQYLAELLSLTQITVLEPAVLSGYKLAVFAPESHTARLRAAMAEAGAGEIGAYRECSFSQPGTGTFCPSDRAQPYLGQPGRLESVPEIRLEMVVPPAQLGKVLRAVYANHPYEEPALDIYPAQHGSRHGLGRVGFLPEPLPLKRLCELVKIKLAAQCLQVSGDPDREIRKVALCSGSGGSLLGAALRERVDLYLTGELNYHTHWEAREQGLAVIEAGHGLTEQCFIPLMTAYLREVFTVPEELIVVNGSLAEPEPYRVV
jgi:dinuclear metal center YbgI/SA1388 family protein